MTARKALVDGPSSPKASSLHAHRRRTAAHRTLGEEVAGYEVVRPIPNQRRVLAAPLAEQELTTAWLLGRIPPALLAPWVLVRAGRAGRGPGPDVREATFALPTGVTLSGDVEVHLEATDWMQHGHADDPRYAGVVVHLVWHDDRVVRGVPQTLPGGGLARTVAVGAALADDGERLRALIRRGPSGTEPCKEWTRLLGPERVTEMLRKSGQARLAERTWRAAALVAERGWDGAWAVLLERALHASAGRRFESPAARVELAARITSGLGGEVMPTLVVHASEPSPLSLIAALRGGGALGAGRAAEVGWNAALPLLAAYAAAYDNVALARATSALAAAWPAPRPYGRTQALAGLLAVAQTGGGGSLRAQGLLHTQELWCERGGCGVCPFSGGDHAYANGQAGGGVQPAPGSPHPPLSQRSGGGRRRAMRLEAASDGASGTP
jgi:hypothetical protein